MDEKVFLEEKQKLKNTVEEMEEEEKYIEKTLSSSNMSYNIEDVAKGQILQMYADKLDNIKKIKDAPYFARMDFKENDKSTEVLYLGKLSILDSKTLEPIVVDWRAPIANLYYEGKLGKASYKVLNKEIFGDIILKRQYMIEKQELKKYVDINVTGVDELLQNALEEKADDRLKNIVATIQDEQNKIIRAPMDSPLIVQGVAGSGKTTIALHRIAYLIYNYEKEFKPEEFMIIAPNKFFLNYISNILPDLGVNDVRQCTFEDFAYDVIGKKLKMPDNNEKLVMIVNNKVDDKYKDKIDIILKESKFKSSIKFKKIIDEYLKKIESQFIPKEDFCYNNYVIMNYAQINNLFINTYKIYNFKRRIFEIEKHLTFELKNKSEEIIENIKQQRSKAIQFLQGEERAETYDKFSKEIELLEKGYKKIIKKYISKIEDKNCIEYYKDFLENYLLELVDQNSDEEKSIAEYMKKSTLENLQRNETTFEDLAPLMYLQYKIIGISDKCIVKHTIIDEAQDYGEFQFDILKTILNSNSMTILGDIAQGVHSYRGIENWKSFIDVEFGNVDVTYTTLKKTYRTTKEIMDVANGVISNLPEYEKEYIVLGEPVIDRKNSIYCKQKNNIKELVESINERIEEHKKNGYKSIAIIGKDIEECKEIQKYISKLREDVKLIQAKDSEYNAGISIVPSYLAKGLEFDCVIIANANSKMYKNNSLDIKLLYVVITRAMSKLDIFYMDKISELFKNNNLIEDF